MKLTVRRLDHVQITIPPRAEDAARDFYGGLLGLEEIEKPEALRRRSGGLWFAIGDIQLHIGADETDAPRSAKPHAAFEVTDLAAIKTDLAANGVPTRDDAPIPGTQRFSFFDPFGNRIELLEKTA